MSAHDARGEDNAPLTTTTPIAPGDDPAASGAAPVSPAKGSRVLELEKMAAHELREFAMIFSCLFPVLVLFQVYTCLVEAALGDLVVHLGYALINAAIGAKVILLTQNLSIVRRYESLPLVWPTLYKTAVFFLFIVIFDVIEKGIEGMAHHEGFFGGVMKTLSGLGIVQISARNLIVVATLVPFMAGREIDRVLGEGTLHRWFFRGVDTKREEHP